ncbi:MAG: hypothetical protein ACLUIW_07990 [Dysosmobacter welbionis]
MKKHLLMKSRRRRKHLAAGNENTDAKPDEGVEPEKQEAPEAQEPETTPKT